MKRIFKLNTIVLCIVFFKLSTAFGQQLPQFSQYIFNGLHINPGYAGYKNEGYIQSTYRSQWVGFEGAPTTFTLTADLSSNEGMMGFGASVMSDKIGPTGTTSAMLTYAYRIQTGRSSYLSLGASAGVSQYMINGDELRAINPDDDELPQGRVNKMTPNMNLGLFYHTDGFYAGASAFNLVGKNQLEREDIALAFHDIHYYITAGGLVNLTDNVQFKPSFLVKHAAGSPVTYDINAMFLLAEKFWIGGSYRSNIHLAKENPEYPALSNRNALAFVTEFYATSNIRIGYAYDYNLNVLQNMRTNSHEISVGYYLSARRVNMRNPRWF